jgi:hypothetical protein
MHSMTRALALTIIAVTLAAACDAGPTRIGAEPEAILSTAPLPGSDWRWTYTEFSDAFCRDGSNTGVATNLSRTSKKLMIYLEQGGACFDESSCAQNPSNATLDLLALGWLLGAAGIFDRTNPENPIRDWNIVYVPYCTGDLHFGTRSNGDIPGVGPQKFVGYTNMAKFLPRIAATFPDSTDVLLAGASAGGFGSLAHLAQVQQVFPNVRVKALDDSGPPASPAILAECLQDEMRRHWGVDDSLLAECGADCPSSRNYLQDFAAHVLTRFADRPIGLLESAEDIDIRAMGDVGSNDCTGTLDLLNPMTSGAVLTQDLLALRKRMEPFANFSTFYPASEVHTWTASSAFYDVRAGTTRAVDWFRAMIEGKNPGHAGP